MSAARVLIEEQADAGVVQTVEPQRNEQKQESVGHEGLVIVGVAIVIALTFTFAAMGSILIALSLRGSGVMGIL
jgi:hypothetical protein